MELLQRKGPGRRAGASSAASSPTSTSRSCKEIGVAGIFLPGTPMQDIVDFINRAVRPRAEAL